MKTRKAKILFTLFITVNLLIGSSFYLAAEYSEECCDNLPDNKTTVTGVSESGSYHNFTSAKEYYNYLMMLHHCKGMNSSKTDHTKHKENPHNCPYIHHLMECYADKEELFHKKFMLDNNSHKNIDLKSVKNAETIPADAVTRGSSIIEEHRPIIALSLQILNSIFLI